MIGAGPAGLASAYFLQQAGLPYRVIDKADVVASTWANLYPSLRLNTTRFYSHMPGRRFPLSFGLFPTGKQYHRYLVRFARDHDLNIELGVAVRRAEPEDGGWRVETDRGAAWYPVVISATGRFDRPFMPEFPGVESFRGNVLHAHDYVGPQPFAGKRVMVVGNGPSGVDIAAELGRYAARPVLLSQRTGVVLRPRYPYGLPRQLWILIAEALPDAIGQPLLRRVSDLRFDNLDRIGIKTPLSEAESSAAGATRGSALIDAVKAGNVRCVDGPVCFEPDAVVLTDGSRHTVDTVILATGYRPVLDRYLDLRVERDPDGWPVRDGEPPEGGAAGRREVKGYPGLYLVGTYYLGKGALFNFNAEAVAAVDEIKTRLAEGRQ